VIHTLNAKVRFRDLKNYDTKHLEKYERTLVLYAMKLTLLSGD